MATIYLYGMPSQRQGGKLVIEVADGIATLADEFAPDGRARYRLSDGRRMDGFAPAAWDFWRLSEEDCAALKKSTDAP